MSRYGIYVYPDTGSKPFYLDDEQCQPLAKLGQFKFYYPYASANLNRVEPPGVWEYIRDRKAWRAVVPGMSDYNCFIVVKKGAHAAGTRGLTGVTQLWTDKLWLEAPYIYLYAECGDYSAWGDDPYGKFFVYDVYGTPKPKSAAGKYGIQLRGMNGVTTLTDFSKLGYCVWAGTVYSDGKKGSGAKIPGYDISNESRYTIYVRPKSQACTMLRLGNSIWTDVPAYLNVLLFDHSPDLSVLPKYGIQICNQNGKTTYTSKYCPLMGGQLLSAMSGYSQYKNPYFNLGNYGTFVSSIKNSYYDLAALGLYVSGNYYDVRFLATVDSGWMGDMWTNNGKVQGIYNTHCIDGDLYL